MSTTAPRGLGLAGLPRLLRRNADYRRLFAATVVSFLGNWFGFVAVSGFVTEQTGSGGLAAVVFAAQVLPVFLVAPVAGVIADRVDRRRLMVTVSCAASLPALGLLGATALGAPWLAIACVALIALCSAFFEPVTAAVVPRLVPRAELSLAQAAIGAVWGTMLFVGAALGGLAAATLGREVSYVLNAVTFLAAAGLVLRIRTSLRPLGPTATGTAGQVLRSQLVELGQFARRRKLTRALLVTKAGVGLSNGIVGLLPAFAIIQFGGDDAAIGLLLGARGAGALVGPIIGRAIARDDGRRLVLVCGGAIIAYGLAYMLLPLTGSVGLAAVCVGLAHTGGGAQWVLSTFGLQASTPDAIRGRVMSLDFGLATGAIGLSALAAGAIAEIIGLAATSWLLVTIAVIYGTAWLVWTRDLWSASEDPLRDDPDAQPGEAGSNETPDDDVGGDLR